MASPLQRKAIGKAIVRCFGSAILILILNCLAAAEGKAKEPLLIAMTEDLRSMCQQAEQLINSGRFKEAEQVLSRAGKLDPNCAEVHGYLGMAYQNSANTQKAIDEYSQALQLNPQMSFIKVNLGTCYMNMNQLNQAVPYFEQYLQENPNAADAAQVRSYIQQAGSRQGVQSLRGTVETGQSLLNQHKYREACQAFEKAISQQPDFAPAHFFLGFALGQSGQNQRAIGEFQTSLQLDPSLKDAVLNIGSNYQSLGDCANAISWYERFLRENPGSPKSGEIQQRISGLRQQMAQQPGPGAHSGTGNAYATPAGSTTGSIGNGFAPATGAAGAAEDYFANVSSSGRYYRWARMPIRVCIMSGAGSAGYRDSFFQVISDAFNKWATASENRISFAPVQDPLQADIICDWTGDPNKVIDAGRAVEGGLTRLMGQPQANGDVIIGSARITILTNRSGQAMSDDDMKKVCLHEIGHALGINGHSSSNLDIMFFSESPTVWPSLTKRDKATICRLYANYPRMSSGNN